jgi:hypothetical protein
MDPNPFAPPRSDFNTDATGMPWPQGTFWRHGPLLMAKSGAVLPPRCVKCNGAADGPGKKQRFYWHHPAWLLLILVSIFIYLIVALLIRSSADVTYGLCQAHRQKRNQGVLIGVGVLVFSVLLFVAAGLVHQPVLFLIGLVLFLVALVVMIVKARTLLPARIENNTVQLKGCGEAFLASLPWGQPAVPPFAPPQGRLPS